MEVKAIDCHVHISDTSTHPLAEKRREVMARYFRAEIKPFTLDELADEYRRRSMMAVLLLIDDSTASGIPPVPNDEIAKAIRSHRDVFIGFGGIDPWKGQLAIDEAKRLKDLGFHGAKFHPGQQEFFPNDPRFYKLWDTCAQEGLVCLFHTGMMGSGGCAPGGMGFKLKYCQPIPYLDDVAADFPSLNIISAHPGWPWQDEQIAMAHHKTNVYIDLSGWSPRYTPQQLVQYADTLLQDRILFGSDYPFLKPERWLREFEDLPIKDEVRQKILLENARRLFGIS